ncbi:glycoside hydrolase family 16 protein [Micromonospora sp. DR5-3]|uniref:glycoside hydrolase family 16 protein n=1 Tax=unclassified Micromonospora TaxID=2617518 RepID=UPI0011D78D10|nr:MULTISPECIES: glycoside hydrolase family 16 protein [unclassified Micromonospora]MCW3820069.1 glycoside hydrolase family 16 protein [Micromonospora sp. DR5-3]TYC19886.1 glycoside hydrolase family 16 protein [Micromonospora sp. MP36]
MPSSTTPHRRTARVLSVSAAMFTTVVLSATSTAGATPGATGGSARSTAILFDDFSYADADDPALTAHHWQVRTGAGGPGVPGAAWLRQNVTFVDDASRPGNRYLQLAAATDGSAAGTSQAEIYHDRKFYTGTYAARVRFTDAPASGPDGDSVVQAFFTITPLRYDLDPDYGELDFEYLPNGGWGATGPRLYATAWETYRLDPWLADNASQVIEGSQAGWHDLVIQVANRKLRFFLDGTQIAQFGAHFYPETPMAIDFNLWFSQLMSAAPGMARTYQQQVDWLYYSDGKVISPEEAVAQVEAYRAAGISHLDTVPQWTP